MNERIEAWLRLRDTTRFNRDAKRAAENIRDIGDAADDAGGAAGGMGDQIGQLSVPLSAVGKQFSFLRRGAGVLAAALLAAAPIALGLAGALTAIVSSAAFATAGLGVLAVGGLGVLGVGLGTVGVLLGQTVGKFQEVSKAMSAYDLAV